MTESNESAVPKHRRRLWCCVLCLLVLVLLGALVLVLALVVFRVRDPTTELVSASVYGVSPHVALPAFRVQLNVTLDLSVLVRNPNRAAFTHPAPGHTQISYRGVHVGDAEVAPGRIPARGSEVVRLVLAVEVDRLVPEMAKILADVVAGAVGFDAETTVPGRITLLGFIKRHAVATSECHVVVGFPELKVRSKECTHKTKL